MGGQKVAIFRPYEFAVGDKIRLEGGPRGGDWEVIGLGERKMKLRCPVSFKEVEWDRFCFHARTEENAEWPLRD